MYKLFEPLPPSLLPFFFSLSLFLFLYQCLAVCLLLAPVQGYRLEAPATVSAVQPFSPEVIPSVQIPDF